MTWIAEYSKSQQAGHLRASSEVPPEHDGDWKIIGYLDCSFHEAVEWFDEWKKRHVRTPSGVPKGTFCHPDDRTIPIGKRKVEFVKWLMRQGEDNRTARLICSRRFYKEEHGK
jgi:hypothetical protein